MKRLVANPYSVTILVPQIEQKINPKDDIPSITYGPNISREFLFDTDVEYGEWQLREGKRLMNDKWIKQFANALNTNIVESEINVDDLPTIIWNDNEYSVLFNDDGTAEIINKFGNVVLTLEDASTIDQVNEQLSDQEVVVDKDVDTEAELVKESKQLIKRLVKANQEIKDILNKAQQYARVDGFVNDFDASLIDFEHTLENIKLTDKKIKEDNNLDITQREYVYYISLNEEDVNTFKNNICPSCNKEDLELVEQNEDEWIVQCTNCGCEYSINPHTGDICLIGDENE